MRSICVVWPPISLPATVVKWDGKAATTTLPSMGLTEATTAHILVYTADAKLANSVAIQLVPAAAANGDKETPKSPSDAKTDAKSADAKAGDSDDRAVVIIWRD